MLKISLRERYQGCLVGLACGDALGAPVEFLPRDSFEPITEMIDGGKFRLNKGQWTDDTSMALCLATSLIETKGFDPINQLEKYYKWLTTGYFSSKDDAFGIGKTILNALLFFHKNRTLSKVNTAPDKAGNGALMRLGPVPLYFYPDKKMAIKMSGESSRTTHGATECIQANKIFGNILHEALNDKRKEHVLLCGGLNDDFTSSLKTITRCEYKNKNRDEIQSTGYVVHTLEAALWCFWNTDSFGDALIKAVNLGGDADTVGAVCGQIAGAYYGIKAIPESWLTDLYNLDMIIKIANDLHDHANTH